jgi:hypothetical protein
LTDAESRFTLKSPIGWKTPKHCTGSLQLANESKNGGYAENTGSGGTLLRVVGLGLLTAASALAGGITVAWWYRKTLTKLQNPINAPDLQNSELSATAKDD